MPSITRREALAAVTAGLATLAGCAGSETSSQHVPEPQSEPISHDVERVRDETGTILFSRVDQTRRTRNGEPVRHGTEFLATEAELDELAFASTETADELRSFVSETDFAAESVFLWAAGVSECRDVHLRRVALDPDGHPQVDFCRSTRPADVACSTEAVHTVGYAIRLPVDGENANGYGTGMSSHCDSPSRPPVFDPSITTTEGNE